jgi:hypothetical protein
MVPNVVFAQAAVRSEDQRADRQRNRREDRRTDRGDRGRYSLSSQTNGVRIEIPTPWCCAWPRRLAMPPALGIMLLTRDMARCAVLCAINPGPFALRHHTIGLCLIFHLIDVFLLFAQSIGLTLIQLAAGNPLINPLLLTGLALVDHRRLSLGIYSPA